MPFDTVKNPKVFKRGGQPTEAEKTLIAQFVADQPTEITPKQINALAKATRRKPAVIKELVAAARDRFAENAGTYVDMHLMATEEAFASGDYETAAKASQWAITNISMEGQRLVDKPNEGPTGPRISIGLQLGGMNTPASAEAPAPAVSVSVVEGEKA